MNKIKIILLLLIVISCRTISHHQINKNLSNYNKVFDYLEAKYYYECEIDLYRDGNLYINEELATNRKILNDNILKVYMQTYKMFNITIYRRDNKISSEFLEYPSITIEFQSKPYIEKRKFIVRYLTDSVGKKYSPILIGGNTYYYEWQPMSY